MVKSIAVHHHNMIKACFSQYVHQLYHKLETIGNKSKYKRKHNLILYVFLIKLRGITILKKLRKSGEIFEKFKKLLSYPLK